MSQSIKLSNNLYWDTSGLHGAKIVESIGVLPGNTTATVNIPNNYRGLVFVTSTSTTPVGIFIVHATSSGGVTVVTAFAGTGLSATKDTNKLILESTSGSNAYMYHLGTLSLSLTA